MTPAQCRAARGLISWTQRHLAKASGVSLGTIADFERLARTPVPRNIEMLRNALIEGGVTFTQTGVMLTNPDQADAALPFSDNYQMVYTLRVSGRIKNVIDTDKLNDHLFAAIRGAVKGTIIETTGLPPDILTLVKVLVDYNPQPEE